MHAITKNFVFCTIFVYAFMFKSAPKLAFSVFKGIMYIVFYKEL
ncbi:hypothetical protein HMPREF0663_11260 [Hoylesella oralis ATCC 33269]|uniref:Uncharacterized protein n=1 Tax=Hoylesella oralis ATCC 33269 TaxID=873533 RepID=E7RQ09_9BACT|nr:hypothetical protein HMPREF0663_11260 [Hoylesella oralis ATCC 33269]